VTLYSYLRGVKGSRFQCPLKGNKGCSKGDGLERVKIPEMHLSGGNKGALRAMDGLEKGQDP
jgi:hypothetical protein